MSDSLILKCDEAKTSGGSRVDVLQDHCAFDVTILLEMLFQILVFKSEIEAAHKDFRLWIFEQYLLLFLAFCVVVLVAVPGLDNNIGVRLVYSRVLSSTLTTMLWLKLTRHLSLATGSSILVEILSRLHGARLTWLRFHIVIC